MLDYFKYGAVIGITALGGAYAGMSDKAETEAVLAKYQFVGKDLERFNVCKVAMIKANVYYDDSTDAGGCACTVAEIKERFPESERDVAHAIDALDAYSVGENYSEEKFNAEVKRISANYRIPEGKMQPMVKKVYKIIEHCSASNSAPSS